MLATMPQPTGAVAPAAAPPASLGLRPGDLVRVRSMYEIAATLDEHGSLDGLPFMPEMVRFCGRTLPVVQRADKTCNGVGERRRMHDTVHLANVRCDGSGHAGCQAACLMYFKEAWLERASAPRNGAQPRELEPDERRFVEETIVPATTRTSAQAPEKTVFRCQATEIPAASTPLHDIKPDQYVRDLRNWPLLKILRGLLLEGVVLAQRAWRKFMPARLHILGGQIWPFFTGRLERGTTPKRTLDLQPGELVRIKSKDEILATLDETNRNRGLTFDIEMTPYCGRMARVLTRVGQLVDENTGEMLDIKSDCIILEGVVCKADFHKFCTRATYPYWREIWLERVEDPTGNGGRPAYPETVLEASERSPAACMRAARPST
jgi:hypothetical protein